MLMLDASFSQQSIVGKSGSLLNDAQHFLACTVFMCIQLFSAVKFCQAYRERNRKGLTYGDADRVCLSYTHDPVSWQTRDSWVLSRFCARFFSLFSEALRTTRIWCQRSSSTTWSAGMSNFHAVAASSCVFHLNTLDTMVQGRRPKWQRNTSSNRHCLNKACEDQRIKMDYAWLRKSVTMQRQPRSFASIFLGTSCDWGEEVDWSLCSLWASRRSVKTSQIEGGVSWTSNLCQMPWKALRATFATPASATTCILLLFCGCTCHYNAIAQTIADMDIGMPACPKFTILKLNR